MTVQRFFRWVAWLLVFAVAAFTLLPVEFRPITGASVAIERFTAFAVIGGTFGWGYPKHRLGIVLVLIGMVGLLEVAQYLVPGRHGRLSDGIVKGSGALLGTAASVVMDRCKSGVRYDLSLSWPRFRRRS